jgi:membrane-associated phospholipid phosphatase
MSPYVLLPLSYCVLLGAYFLASGKFLQFMPLLLLAALPVVTYRDSSRGLLKSWIPLVMILLSYEALNGVVGSLAASDGIHSLYGVDSFVWGGNLTGWVQSYFNSSTLTSAMILLYELHMPLVVVTAFAIWRWRRGVFGHYVTVMAIVSFSALVTFVLFPTAPPWFTGAAKDLLANGNANAAPGLVSWLNGTILSDKFAAFPSLHTSYALVFGYFMVRLDKRLALVVIPIVGGILFSTVYLGQHYVIDLLGGAGYVTASCLLAEKFQLFSTEQLSKA